MGDLAPTGPINLVSNPALKDVTPCCRRVGRRRLKPCGYAGRTSDGESFIDLTTYPFCEITGGVMKRFGDGVDGAEGPLTLILSPKGRGDGKRRRTEEGPTGRRLRPGIQRGRFLQWGITKRRRITKRTQFRSSRRGKLFRTKPKTKPIAAYDGGVSSDSAWELAVPRPMCGYIQS